MGRHGHDHRLWATGCACAAAHAVSCMTPSPPDAFDVQPQMLLLPAGASCACNAPDCTCVSDGNFNSQLQVQTPH